MGGGGKNIAQIVIWILCWFAFANFWNNLYNKGNNKEMQRKIRNKKSKHSRNNPHGPLISEFSFTFSGLCFAWNKGATAFLHPAPPRLHSKDCILHWDSNFPCQTFISHIRNCQTREHFFPSKAWQFWTGPSVQCSIARLSTELLNLVQCNIPVHVKNRFCFSTLKLYGTDCSQVINKWFGHTSQAKSLHFTTFLGE